MRWSDFKFFAEHMLSDEPWEGDYIFTACIIILKNTRNFCNAPKV